MALMWLTESFAMPIVPKLLTEMYCAQIAREWHTEKNAAHGSMQSTSTADAASNSSDYDAQLTAQEEREHTSLGLSMPKGLGARQDVSSGLHALPAYQAPIQVVDLGIGCQDHASSMPLFVAPDDNQTGPGARH